MGFAPKSRQISHGAWAAMRTDASNSHGKIIAPGNGRRHPSHNPNDSRSAQVNPSAKRTQQRHRNPMRRNTQRNTPHIRHNAARSKDPSPRYGTTKVNPPAQKDAQSNLARPHNITALPPQEYAATTDNGWSPCEGTSQRKLENILTTPRGANRSPAIRNN